MIPWLSAWLLARAMRKRFRPRLAAASDLLAFRALIDRAPLPARRNIVIKPDRVGGVAGEWLLPGDGMTRAAMVYLHGGGWAAGSPATHRAITSAFAARGFAVFAPAYRLAPEYPYPAAIEDMTAVWTVLSATRPLVLAGDSAGGNLALALLLRARDAGLALPRAVALLSPCTDLTPGGAHRRGAGSGEAMLDPALLKRLMRGYRSGADPLIPEISPARADLAGLPPMTVHVGRSELLRADALQLVRAARRAAVAVKLRQWLFVPHCWQLHAALPEARQSIRASASFLLRHCQ